VRLESGSSLPADEVLVARLRARDAATFALLVDSWSPGMQRLARSFVTTPDSAAEVVQDTWLAVIRGLDTFQGRASLKTWVYRILVNTAKRRGAREGRTIPLSSLPDGSGPTVDPARFGGPNDPFPGHWVHPPAAWPSPEQNALSGEIRAQLVAALAALPDRQRVVITLRDVEGYTAEEVSSILDITPGNQRVLLHRARAFVRQRLEDYFVSVGAVHANE
jgi:RNA polymerase sigma-70 factor, ECF subfamily